MKLRYLVLMLLQISTLSLTAMSPEERTEFKAQLKAARTSHDMERVIQTRLDISNMDKFFERRAWYWSFDSDLLYRIDDEYTYPKYVTLLEAISPIIEDCIFEELYALLSSQVDGVVRIDDSVDMWLKKYSWADKTAVHITVGFTQKIKNFLKYYPDGPPAPTDPDDRLGNMKQDERDQFLLIKARMLQYSNPEYIRSREQRNTLFSNNNLRNYKIVVLGGLTMSALLGGIYYWTIKSDKQDEKDTAADQETINNDAAQDAFVHTK